MIPSRSGSRSSDSATTAKNVPCSRSWAGTRSSRSTSRSPWRAPQDPDRDLLGHLRGIDDYDDGATAVPQLLELLTARASRLSHFLLVDEIARFVAADTGLEERRQRAWTDEVRHRIGELADQTKAMPRWEEMATQRLTSSDLREFHAAERTAGAGP